MNSPYILVSVTDPDFENVSESNEDFQRDSIEIYFDETRARNAETGEVEAAYDDDCFQYRQPYNNMGINEDRGNNYLNKGYNVESASRFFKIE